MIIIAVSLAGVNRMRAVFRGLVVVGMGMCAVGMQLERYGWTNPLNIVGIVLGVVALAVAGAVFFRLNLPLVSDERSATIMLGGIMVLKVVLTVVRGIRG